MIGLWSYTNFRLRNKECEVLLGGIVFYFIFKAQLTLLKQLLCICFVLEMHVFKYSNTFK